MKPRGPQALELNPSLNRCILHIENQTFVEAVTTGLTQENKLDYIKLNPVFLVTLLLWANTKLINRTIIFTYKVGFLTKLFVIRIQ